MFRVRNSCYHSQIREMRQVKGAIGGNGGQSPVATGVLWAIAVRGLNSCEKATIGHPALLCDCPRRTGKVIKTAGPVDHTNIQNTGQ
mgnify:CR=1 FL=1